MNHSEFSGKTHRRRTAGRARIAVLLALGGLSLAACGSSGSSAGGSSSDAPAVLETINYAYPAAAVSTLPALLMQSNPAMCAPFGVKPTVTLINPGTATPAVFAGQQDVLSGSPTSFLLAALKDPTSAKIVAAETGGQPADFFAPKSVTSFADLKGKTVAAGTAAGSASDISTRALLTHAGLTAGKDVQLTYSGSLAAIVGLAQSNTVQGLITNAPLPSVLTDAGWHSLTSLKDDPVTAPLWANVAFVANTQFTKNHPKAMTGFLKCLAAAEKIVNSDTAKDKALLIAGGVSESDANDAVGVLKPFTVKKFPADALKIVQGFLQDNKVADFGTTDLSTTTIDNSFAP